MSKEDQKTRSSNDMEFMSFEQLQATINGDEPTEDLDLTDQNQDSDKKEDQESSLKNNDKTDDLDDPSTSKVESEKSKGAQSDISTKNRQRLKKLYGNKLQTIIQEVDGEDVEVSIDDIEIDDDTFEDLLEQGKRIELEQATKDKIPVEGISDTIKKIIEIHQNGGDITEILNAHKYTQSVDSIDINTPEGQKHAIFLLHRQKGIDEETIQDLISGYIQTGTLAERGMEAQEKVKKRVDEFVEQRRLNAIEQKKKNDEWMKGFKKDLNVALSENFQINDTYKSKLVDFSSKPNAEGKFEMDQVYLESRKDPVKSAKLALFLHNMEEYDKQVASEKVLEKQMSIAGKARLTTKSQRSTSAKSEEKVEGFMSFEELNSKTKH